MKHTIIETRKIIYLLMAVTFGLQLLVYFSFDVTYAGDAKVVLDSAKHQLQGGLKYYDIIYFLNNPNNLMLLYLDMFFLRLEDLLHISGENLLSVAGMMLSTIATGLSACLCWEITRSNILTYILYATCAFLICFNPWCTVPYTDVFSICIPIAVFYRYVINISKGKTGWRRIYLPLLLSVLGILLKPTCIFAGIAILMVELARLIKTPNTMRKLGQIVAVVAGVLVLCIAGLQIEKIGVNYKTDETYLKPWTHYVMMGLNEKKYGRYYRVDDDYTNSFTSKEEKIAANKKVIKERLEKMGVAGYVSFAGQKTINTYSDGSFAWGIWSKDSNQIVLKELRNVIWIILLISSFANTIAVVVVGAFKKRVYSWGEMAMVFMGAMVWLYLLIFETGARYLYMFAPCYILVGFLGIYKIVSKLCKKELVDYAKK